MASLTDMRERNRLRILQALRLAGAADRAELTRLTGLSRATVSGLVGDALARGHVVEVEPDREGARRSALLRLDPRAGVVAGVDLDHRGIRVVLADLAAEVLGERTAEADVDGSAEVALDLAAGLVDDLVGAAGLPRERLVGVGLGVPGPVDRETGVVRSASILTGWLGVHPADELARRVGVPVRVENDGNLGALGEHVHGAARGASDVVYVKLATGVGGGLILDGALYGGARGSAGELGHVSVEPDGGICRCGNRGCLELVAAAGVLPEVGASRAGGYVARAVAPVCLALDVPLVVVGGDGATTPRLVAGVRGALRKACAAGPAIEVRPAALGARAEALGAVVLALRQEAWLRDAGLISLLDGSPG